MKQSGHEKPALCKTMFWFLEQEAFHLVQTRTVLYNIQLFNSETSEDISYLSVLEDNSWNVLYSKQPKPDKYNWGMVSNFEILTKAFMYLGNVFYSISFFLTIYAWSVYLFKKVFIYYLFAVNFHEKMLVISLYYKKKRNTDFFFPSIK